MNRLPRFHVRVTAAVLGTLGLALLAGTPAAAHESGVGSNFVYTMSNASAGNSVLGFRAEGDGLFRPMGTFSTGGTGTGAGLGSQGAIALAEGGSRLLAVNAGSNTVSAFVVRADGRLNLLGTAPSGGADPISVTARGRLVYVLNAGTNSVSGLQLGDHGLTPLPGSTRSLSAGAQAPVQASFTPDGELLIVTEKASNTIDTFIVGTHGLLGQLITNVSDGTTPFGFDFDRAGRVVVSDASGGVAGASAATSYRTGEDGTLLAINLVPDAQTAACWVVVDRSGNHAYLTNTGSGTVSAYSISHDGSLTLLAGIAASTGGHPIDEAIGGQRLFVLDAAGRIVSARILTSGLLGTVSTGAAALPGSATGLATTSED